MTNQAAIERIIQESMKRHIRTHDPALAGVVAATVLHICGELSDDEYEKINRRILLRQLTPETSNASGQEKDTKAPEAKNANGSAPTRRKVRRRANG